MTGRVRRAIVFTDIVSSTAIRARIGDDAADSLRREHDHVVGSAVRAAGGQVVKGLGDGMMAAFPDVHGALDAVARAMTVLASRNVTAAEPIEVTVGIDVGDVAEEEGDLFGMTVVRAARLCALATPGQVLVTWDAVAEDPPDTVHDRGRVHLKGVPDAVAIGVLAWGPGASLDLPVGSDLRNGSGTTTITTAGHVPAVPTPILGRADELADLARCLEEHRLLSLVGPGAPARPGCRSRSPASCRPRWPTGPGSSTCPGSPRTRRSRPRCRRCWGWPTRATSTSCRS